MSAPATAPMGDLAVDMRAEALLLTLTQQNGGDLRAAFAVLCGCASVTDVMGEAFETALARAVRDLFGRPDVNAAVAPQPHAPAGDPAHPSAT